LQKVITKVTVYNIFTVASNEILPTRVEFNYVTVYARQLTCILLHITMKTYGGVEVIVHILDLGTGQWSASRPCCFTADESAPCTHLLGGWLVPRAGLEALD
jgi:hypothetical protein